MARRNCRGDPWPFGRFGWQLYVAGAQKVIEFGPQGQYLSTWIPRVPPREGAVCELGGQPAVPALGGVVRRGDDGEDEAIGPVVTGDFDPDTWAQDGAIVEWQLWKSKIACNPHAAFVVAEYGADLVPSEYEEESDSVTVYYRASNRKGRLLIPEALAVGQAVTVGRMRQPTVGATSCSSAWPASDWWDCGAASR